MYQLPTRLPLPDEWWTYPCSKYQYTGEEVRAFVRIDDKPILMRGYIAKPDILMLLDESIIEVKDVFSDLPAECTIIINGKGQYIGYSHLLI
ncbi:MAG: hypothetical protein U9N09_07680 [Euryarchaeota archaeon]|nr:hypothetical protein [Euryarchaeota archaeon]